MNKQFNLINRRRITTLLLSCLIHFGMFAQKQESSYTIPRHVPVNDGDVFSNITCKIITEEDDMEGYNRLDVTVNVKVNWEAYKYQGKLYSIDEINKKNAIPDPHFDGFVFDKELVIPKQEYLVVLNDGQHFTFTLSGGIDNTYYQHLELRQGADHSVKMVTLTNSPKNEHVHKILSHELCTSKEVNSTQNSSESNLNSNATSNALQNTNASSFQDPWAINTTEAYFDPAEVLKAEATDIFRELANESGNKTLAKVADNCENVRTYAMLFKAANPEYLEEIGKLENYSMFVGIIAPFIFKQSDKPDEAQLRQNDLAKLRAHEDRTIAFEKRIMVDVLTVKEQMLKVYARGEKEKFAKYYQAYLTLLNTPVVMYNPEGLMYNFYADLDRSNSWEANMRNNPMSPALEKKLETYYFNTTLGEIYYGNGKEATSKKILDALIYMSLNPNTQDEDIVKILKKYPLYKSDFRMFDYQPYLFALNYAHINNKNVLFDYIWKLIDNNYKELDNSLEKIQVSEKLSEQKNHLKSIGYPIIGLTSNITNAEEAKNGIMHSMSYSLLKRRYDLLKENALDPKYDYRNILIAYAAFDTDKAALGSMGILNLGDFHEAYLLQMMMENIFGTQEEALRLDDKKLFLSVMRKAMKISNAYNKKTNGENVKEKNNYFKPTYYNEVKVTFISTYDYVKNAKGFATIGAELSQYFIFDNEYVNPAFFQDSKMTAGRVNWYNAWAHYYRTGDKSEVEKYKINYNSNPYVIFEWLVSYGTPVQ